MRTGATARRLTTLRRRTVRTGATARRLRHHPRLLRHRRMSARRDRHCRIGRASRRRMRKRTRTWVRIPTATRRKVDRRSRKDRARNCPPTTLPRKSARIRRRQHPHRVKTAALRPASRHPRPDLVSRLIPVPPGLRMARSKDRRKVRRSSSHQPIGDLP